VPPPSVAPAVRADQEAMCERATKVVTELITRMGFDASATTTMDARTREIFVRVQSQGVAHLIGRRGQTLDALEHILTRMLFPGEASSERQIVLDIGGYRDRRRDELLRLAPKLKAEAIARRCRVLVGPMNSRDRKVLIGALTGDSTIDVQSEGTGFYRRVQIAPAGTRGENLPADVISDELVDDTDTSEAGGADRQGVPD
jgi:spoIIIJ-associated protein